MGELLKRVEEYRVETEEQAEELITRAKEKSNEEGYELTQYCSTHKVRKDDDFFVVKLTKVW